MELLAGHVVVGGCSCVCLVVGAASAGLYGRHIKLVVDGCLWGRCVIPNQAAWNAGFILAPSQTQIILASILLFGCDVWAPSPQ